MRFLPNATRITAAAVAAATAFFVAACAAPVGAADNAALVAQVMAAERAFAKTMADRALQAFGRYVAEDTVFFLTDPPLRGRAAVIDGWRFFERPDAPFSWEPDQVEVLDSGQLALSTGPVRNPKGEIVSRFSSIWRQEAPGTWRVVFDRGEPVCRCDAADQR